MPRSHGHLPSPATANPSPRPIIRTEYSAASVLHPPTLPPILHILLRIARCHGQACRQARGRGRRGSHIQRRIPTGRRMRSPLTTLHSLSSRRLKNQIRGVASLSRRTVSFSSFFTSSPSSSPPQSPPCSPLDLSHCLCDADNQPGPRFATSSAPKRV